MWNEDIIVAFVIAVYLNWIHLNISSLKFVFPQFTSSSLLRSTLGLGWTQQIDLLPMYGFPQFNWLQQIHFLFNCSKTLWLGIIFTIKLRVWFQILPSYLWTFWLMSWWTHLITILGWFSNRTGTSFDDGKARGKD